jgi:hypothetical protein
MFGIRKTIRFQEKSKKLSILARGAWFLISGRQISEVFKTSESFVGILRQRNRKPAEFAFLTVNFHSAAVQFGQSMH